MSVGPSSPLPGARGRGVGLPPRLAASPGGHGPFPSLLVPSPPPPPHFTPPARSPRAVRAPLPPPPTPARLSRAGGAARARSARACRDRRMDGWSERARTRACARAPLSPSLGAGARPGASALQPPPLPPPAPPQHPALALPSSSSFRFRAPSDCSRLLEGPERVHLPRGRSSAAFALGGGDRDGRRGATPPSKVPADGNWGGEMGGATVDSLANRGVSLALEAQ